MNSLRLVCLAAEIPEILDRLGVLHQVVGISAYTTRPEAALQIPKVSGFRHGSVDRILSMQPNLAILTSGVQRDLALKLAERGLPMLHLNPHRLDDLFETIHVLGELVGEPHKAEALSQELHAQINEIRKLGEALPWHPRVYFEEWMDPMIVGTGWVSDIIEIAGGTDVFREKAIHGRKVTDRYVTSEEIAAAAPEMILASWCGKPFEADVVRARPGAYEIPAVRNGALQELDGTILQCGPMLIDALRYVHQLIRTFVYSDN